MKKQALIIGLGQFGMGVARALTARQAEVLAVDQNEELVRLASSFVTEAVCFDASDEAALARTLPNRRDVCFCALGDEAKEGSIICTALLKQMGAQRVISRANNALHARILTLVGADQVINPEREFGERFASQVLYDSIRGEMPLGDGVLISEVAVPSGFVGQSLGNLQLPKRFHVTLVAVRRGESGVVVMPSAELSFAAGDVMVVVARDGVVAQMMERGKA